MSYLEIFIGTDQPATCPKCGSRTEILKEEIKYQHHKCPIENCSLEFTLEFEEEDEI
jgi:hypothetical protein